MANISTLIKANTNRWNKAHLTRQTDFMAAAKRLVAKKSRYLAVQVKTNVPWFVIAVIHERESSQDFGASLAQGDPWDKVSVHVPAGRGPFKSWEDAAIDALVNCPPYAGKWKDWSAGGSLTLLEQYNGLGYFNRGLPSPYVWAGTDQYIKGKYVVDGRFDPNYVDKQLGCAGLILAMQTLDKSIVFGNMVFPPPPDIEPVDKTPEPTQGTKHAVAATSVIGGTAAAVNSHSIEMVLLCVGIGIAVAVAVYFLWPNKKD